MTDQTAVPPPAIPAPRRVNEHVPILIPGFEPGTWRVACFACTMDAGEYRYPCRAGAWHPTLSPPAVVQRAY